MIERRLIESVLQVGLTASTASWGGQPFFILAVVMWWIGTAVMITVAALTIIVLSKTNIVDATTTLNPALIIPFVGTTTVSGKPLQGLSPLIKLT